MAVKKSKGIITNHIQRQHAGRDIKPCKWFSAKTGSGIMVAQYKDTRDLVIDGSGTPIAWNRA
jgi:hypothetical protein